MDDAYWDRVIDDVSEALTLLRPTFDPSAGGDGFVSIEVAPDLARDTVGTITAARDLHARVDQPNLFVKIPATAEGLLAIQAMTAEGRSVNITLIFSLSRYRQVIEAYRSGLEKFTGTGGDVSAVNSGASFFVSRVDSEVDRRLESIGTPEAFVLRGRAGVAQAKLVYQLFSDQSPTIGGSNSQNTVHACNGCDGLRPRQRTRRSPTRCTSITSSAPTR